MPTDPRTSPEIRARLAELESAHREAVSPAVIRLTAARDKVDAASLALSAARERADEAQSRLDALHAQHEARTLPLYAALGRNACHGEPTDAPEDAAPVEAAPAPVKRGPGRPRKTVVRAHERALPGAGEGVAS